MTPPSCPPPVVSEASQTRGRICKGDHRTICQLPRSCQPDGSGVFPETSMNGLTWLSCLPPRSQRPARQGVESVKEAGNCNRIHQLLRGYQLDGNGACFPETLTNGPQSSSSKRIPPTGPHLQHPTVETADIYVIRMEILFRSVTMLLGPGDAERQHG